MTNKQFQRSVYTNRNARFSRSAREAFGRGWYEDNDMHLFDAYRVVILTLVAAVIVGVFL